MPETSARDAFDRRLPLYAYLEPLFAGRRVLELGCGSGAGALYIAAHGAARVLGVDTDAAAVERARARQTQSGLELRAVGSLLDAGALGETFDVIVVPDGEELLRRSDAVVDGWKRALEPGGRLVIAATSADRSGAAAGRTEAAGGVGYYELADALAAHFPRVQMFGVTPFAGFGMVEFDGGAEALRVDSRLVEEAAEPSVPHAYLAVAGDDPAEDLGYALVQLPFAPVEAGLAGRAAAEERGAAARLAASERRLEEAERRARARVEEAEGRIGDLRRKLDDAAAQSESAMRVVRAQGEEIEELRGRVRRAAEDRAALDGEIGKLRRALAEADESVMSLTRKTAEEMSAVAQRLAAGLREMEPAPRERAGELSPAREEAERLRVALAETEARAAAAEQRLEEIATEGRERQAALDDALERLRLAEDAVARERREVTRLQGDARTAAEGARTLEQRQAALAARDERIARLEGDKQDLVWRLAELEEKLREAIARAVAADGAKTQSEDLVAARAGRERALEEFRRAAETHVAEATQLRESLAEQTALASELEDAVQAAEARATAATAEAASLRKNAKALEEADRTRRSRLAELEGKLLRLEHERKAAAAAAAAAAASNGKDDRPAPAPVPAPAPHNGHDPMLRAAARELDAVQAAVAAELERLRDIEQALGETLAAASAAPSASASAAAVEASLLEARVANYRRLAGRLRDELEGIRRRWDSLSPAEISGYLDELGEDLAELEG